MVESDLEGTEFSIWLVADNQFPANGHIAPDLKQDRAVYFLSEYLVFGFFSQTTVTSKSGENG